MLRISCLLSCLVVALLPAGCAKHDRETGGAAKSARELELVRAAGEPMLTQAYQSCLALLEQAPANPDLLLQRAFHLMHAGSLLADKDRAKSAEAVAMALPLAEQLADDQAQQSLQYDAKLSQIFYYAACSLARQGQTVAATEALQRAVKLGWDELDYLRTDAELAEICQRTEFESDLATWVGAARDRRIRLGRAQLVKGVRFPFDFTLEDLQGTVARLQDFRGEVVIVDFWGTWCPPCREEIPMFNRLLNKYGDQGLQIVGLAYEQTGSAESDAQQLTQFLEGAQVGYPCLLGTDKVLQQVPDFSVFPTTLFIDRQGQVRIKLEGVYSYAYLESLTLALLDESSESNSPGG